MTNEVLVSRVELWKIHPKMIKEKCKRQRAKKSNGDNTQLIINLPDYQHSAKSKCSKTKKTFSIGGDLKEGVFLWVVKCVKKYTLDI